VNCRKAERGNGRNEGVLGIVQGYAQLAVRFIGRMRIEVTVRNRRSRNRHNGEDGHNNQNSTKTQTVHNKSRPEIIGVCALDCQGYFGACSSPHWLSIAG